MPELTISRKSWYLRLFLWGWRANPENLNICKLFWGTIFFPVTLFHNNREYRFIPRNSIFYLAVGAIFLGFRSWFPAAVFLGVGTAVLVFAYLSDVIGRSRKGMRQEGDEKRLLWLTKKCGGAFEWFLDNTFGRLMDLAIDLAIDIEYSRAGCVIGGFLDVIVHYSQAIRHRVCPMVRVVD